MPKTFIFLAATLALLVFPARAHADITILDSEKVKFAVYGFIKLDCAYQDGGVNGLAIARYAAAGSANFFLSAQHTRFGFKISGPATSGGWKFAALLEWDLLDPASANQMKFRTRQANLTAQKGRGAWLVGQGWDLFSPLGPTTLMTNGFLWQTGNLGFRHAQVRYTNSGHRVDLAAALADPGSTAGWKTKTPVLQGRIGLKLGSDRRFQVGASGIYGREAAEGDSFKNDVSIIGASLDWNLPLSPRFTIKGEYARGSNLAYAMGRSGITSDTTAGKFKGKAGESFWSQLVYTRSQLTLWLGYAWENLCRECQLSTAELRRTACLFAGGQLALGSGASVGLEYSRFRSSHYLANTLTTNQILFSANYTF